MLMWSKRTSWGICLVMYILCEGGGLHTTQSMVTCHPHHHLIYRLAIVYQQSVQYTGKECYKTFNNHCITVYSTGLYLWLCTVTKWLKLLFGKMWKKFKCYNTCLVACIVTVDDFRNGQLKDIYSIWNKIIIFTLFFHFSKKYLDIYDKYCRGTYGI